MDFYNLNENQKNAVITKDSVDKRIKSVEDIMDFFGDLLGRCRRLLIDLIIDEEYI